MANSQEGSASTTGDPDLIAAVVLHTLVSAAGQTQSLEQTILACERDPDTAADREAIEAALATLQADGLALAQGEGYAATRAAIRAAELSF